MARSAAKVIKQVRNATNDIKREIMDSAEDQKLTEVKKTIEEGRDAFKEVTDSIKRGTKI
jgi:Sec-independent protein translocase protein TatA